MATSRRRRLALGGLVLAAVSACGTTVPRSAQLSSDGGAVSTNRGAGGSGGQGADHPGPAATPATGAPSEPVATGAAGEQTGPTVTNQGGVPVSKPGGGAASALPGSTPAPGGPGQRPKQPAPGSSAKASAKPATSAGASASKTGAGGASTSGTASSTAPLKIGFVYIDASTNAAANSAAGATTSTTITIRNVVEAMRDYYNAHGGLDGRQVSLVELPQSDQSTTYDSDATAACQTLSVDTPVQVAIDTDYGPNSGFAQCLDKAGIEDLDMVAAPDAATLAGLPYLAALQEMTPDRAYPAAVDQLVKSGYLKPSNKVGVFMDTCATTMAAYRSAILPDLKRQGLTPVQTNTTPCIGGYDGLGQASSDSASAVLAFQSNMVDRVLIVSTQDSTYYTLFNVAANSQQYTPGYVMTTTAEAGVQAGSFQAGQRPGIHGAGYLPTLDTSNAKVPGTPADASCQQMVNAEQVAPSSIQDFYYLALGCSPFTTLQAAFKADGANAAAPVLSKAIAGLGTTVSNPGTLGGVVDFSQQDAPRDAQVFGYQSSCSCVSYSGSPTAA